MTALVVKRNSFSALSKLYSQAPDGLAQIIRGLAIDNARIAMAVASLIDFTDNSTGTAGSSVADVPAVATIDASSLSVGTPATALNTALGKLDNAFAVVAQNVNLARTRLGLPTLTYTGTVAVAGTIPACDKTLAATSGTSTATYASVKTAIDKAEANLKKLAYAANDVFTAMGLSPTTVAIAGPIPVNTTIVAVGTASASSTGADAASDATVDAALTAIVNGIAKIAADYNTAMGQASTATTPLNVIAG